MAGEIHVSVGLDKTGNVVEVRDRHGNVRKPEQNLGAAVLKTGSSIGGRQVSNVLPIDISLVTDGPGGDDSDGDPCVICIAGICYRIC